MKTLKELTKKELADNEVLAKAMALHCFRNTFLEDLHAGITPSSKTGDYSDVKVITPYGEIPWNELSRFSDEEMKKLMIEVVNLTHTFLIGLLHTGFSESSNEYITINSVENNWDKAKIVKGWLK